MTRGIHQRQLAVTLVELTASVAIMGILIGGLGSAMVLASRAIPDGESPARTTTEACLVAEQIAGELFCAQTFTERSATVIEFAVADRNNDSSPETIRYEWSGTPGDPLTRQYNGGTAAVVAEDVNDFALSYDIMTQSETTTQDGTTWSDETELAYFDGWAGVSALNQSHTLGPGHADSEYFEITPPDGVDQIKITMAKVVLSHTGTPPAQGVQVSIRRSKGDGSYEPNGAAIGTPATIPGGALTTSPLWTDAMFSDVVVSDPSRHDYCLVVEVPAIPPAYVYHYYSKSAPDDGMYHRWTEDAGATWDPSKNIDDQDLRFSVYGQFASSGTQEITVDRYFVAATRIALQIGADSATRVETSIQNLNSPEVASP